MKRITNQMRRYSRSPRGNRNYNNNGPQSSDPLAATLQAGLPNTMLDTASDTVQPHDGRSIVPFGLSSSTNKQNTNFYIELLLEGSVMKLHPIVTQDTGTQQSSKDNVIHNLDPELQSMELARNDVLMEWKRERQNGTVTGL